MRGAYPRAIPGIGVLFGIKTCVDIAKTKEYAFDEVYE